MWRNSVYLKHVQLHQIELFPNFSVAFQSDDIAHQLQSEKNWVDLSTQKTVDSAALTFLFRKKASEGPS